MAPGNSQRKDDAAHLVLRQIRATENVKFLRRMPTFKMSERLPERLNGMLDDLERAERRFRAGGNQSGALGAASGPQRK